MCVHTSARAMRLDSFRITVHRHTNSKDTRHKNKIRLALSFVERNKRPRSQGFSLGDLGRAISTIPVLGKHKTKADN